MRITLLLVFTLGLSACYYDVEEEIYPEKECDTDSVSYQADIVPVLMDNCFVCHSAQARQGGIILEGYDQVKEKVNSGQLLGAIRHDPGFSPMPQGGAKLPECTIQKIESWIADGAPNN